MRGEPQSSPNLQFEPIKREDDKQKWREDDDHPAEVGCKALPFFLERPDQISHASSFSLEQIDLAAQLCFIRA